jgi:hypothetical protein
MRGQAIAAGALPERWLEARIEAYERYAALVRAQIDAVERGDLDAFGALVRQREALARELDGPAYARLEPVAATAQRAAALREALERCAEADRRLLERLHAMRAEARDRLRRLEARGPRIGAYLRGGPRAPRLDVRL